MKFSTMSVLVGILLGAALIGGCITTTPPETTTGEVALLYTSVGQMPQLLATDQIDGYMAWQPFVAVGKVTGMGTIVSYSQDLPPRPVWEDHSCDSLVARNVVVDANPVLADSLAMVLIHATDYTRENPDAAAAASAEWIFGSSDLTFGNITVSPLDVERASIPTIKFVNEPSEQWMASNDLFIDALTEIQYLQGTLANASQAERNNLLYNFGPYENAKANIKDGKKPLPTGGTGKITIGYLLSDHDAPLFVAIKEWQYYNDNFGIALRPSEETEGKVENAELVVNGQKIADVQLVKGESGAQLMTLMASNAIDFAVAGTPPTITAIDKGTPIRILFPLHTEGSGLVVTKDAQLKENDWEGFITWVKSAGRPVKIAVAPKGSIQDVQLRYALEQSGLVVNEAK
ncbi:MAG: ABC transporter substrate-binding protein [Methanolinea sp.]|jgi:NitT/TauT family transport system substrate-binding protein|nr:ABC transporter substrate-binding protein [Methanolinea sp.]